MLKKFTSLMVCLALLSGSICSYASAEAIYEKPEATAIDMDYAVPSTSYVKGTDPTEEALKNAIISVKEKIEIPDDYSEFNYYYYGSNSYSGAYWSLTWRRPSDYSYIDVSLDADNNIISYYTYDYSEYYRGIPSYLKDELRDEAEDFIKQIAPDIAGKLELVSAEYSGVFSNTYIYNFQRIENGVIFPDNTVSVSVNSATGKIRNASINWLRGVKVPSADVKLAKDEAAKIIGENLKMKLSYKTNYFRIFDGSQTKYEKKAFLVYEPDLPYISVDAKTGEVYLTKNEWIVMDSVKYDAEGTNEEALMKDGGSVSLTEEEMARIRELENLISKDKAIEIVTSNKYLYIDESLITYTAVLTQTYNTSEKDRTYVWNITLKDSRPVDYSKDEDTYRAYAYASVDAKTGKILSFYASLRNYYDYASGKWIPVDIKYTREQGREILEKFLMSQVKSRFEKTQLVKENDDYVVYYKDDKTPVYGGYSYNYNRFNEGVEFPYNGIYGSVDGITGKIYYFGVNWDDDIIFESPKNAMSPEEAFRHYISKDGYGLKYEINVLNQYDPNYGSKERYYDYSEAYKVDYEIRLVYRPDINPAYISPFTGEQLDYRGEVYTTDEPYHYSDIADTEENRDIFLLADMDIGFEGGKFLPNMLVTEGEVNQLLEKLGYWSSDNEAASASDKLITREELAYTFIKKLGLESIARIPGIYTTGYADESLINKDYVGAVALAKGLKLMPDDGSSLFNPKNKITRRELVTLLLHFARAEADRYY